MVGGGTLIHPHEASNLPGYRGYTPQLKFQCGHTYGYQTDKLSKEFTEHGKSKCSVPPKLKLPDLPINGVDDQKYVKQMVPGYTGFVPQHGFKYGQTYAYGTEEAISECKFNYHTLAMQQQDLQQTIRSRKPMSVVQNSPPPHASHPGVNMRYVLSFGKQFDDKRDFTEPPIPGYQGYVPRKEEHILGEKYNVWTRHAYNHAAETIATREKQKEGIDVGTINISRSTWPPKTNANDRLGTVYSKNLGMTPNYTGFVPQRRYDFGTTYGDSTRSMPVCSDTFGYSLGRYNDTGKVVTPTVIPVRI